MQRVVKRSFSLEAYTLEGGATIPVTLGYETYGTLNEQKNNVILVCHYFSANSHAAGKYSPDDSLPGWWDGLIGPGKAVDTDKYFVICTDNLCNVQAKNPLVITTGPKSINPETGRSYGMTFPAFTFRDMAGIQYELMKQLDIRHLVAVMGPSAGGMIALHWAVQYPTMMDHVIGVNTAAQNPIMTSFNVLQHAMRTIKLDSNWNNGEYSEQQEPLEGLHLAIQMMNINAFTASYQESAYPRDSKEAAPYACIETMTSYECALYDKIAINIPLIDANHWLYTARATMMQDVSRGFDSLEEALSRIQARVLMIPCEQDLLQPPEYSQKVVDILKKQGKEADLHMIRSDKGHMAGVLEPHLFENEVKAWLKAGVQIGSN
ncbi:alpha/beta fold hydrolase [Paenibacillus agilis]|uniref:Probable acyltransferase n=1 Tax=Paenibacillus agilis TaxID=3020863 RepID=A0A559J410_9BACL|nr:homoserine O-acetyltransferase [Paenibacillus agilis]TVX94613.1 homoserine O-acetyltransferase [Paenibacillus agilis]